MQHGRDVALLFQPLLECDRVQCAPLRIDRGQLDRNAERAFSVDAAGLLERFDVLEEARLLGEIRCGHVLRRQYAFLPFPVPIHARFGRMHQRGLIEIGSRCERIAAQQAEIAEQLAHMYRFRRRQRDVMSTARKSELAEMAAGRVAAEFRAAHDDEALEAFLREFPCSRQSGYAAAENRDIGGELIRWGRDLIAIAQPVAVEHARVVDDRRPFEQPGLRAAGQCGGSREE
jgi:hypothetical protein